MGQAIGLGLAAVGAVVGGVLSGGALIGVEAGFMAGSILGALLFPPKKPSPADVRVQDSAYGKWIPKVWGRYRLAGNVIWMGTPHSHATGGGKGMGGKSQQPYTTLSFAVALCQGQIDAVNRIWANGKLIYDVSQPSNWQQISGSTSMVTAFTVYNGSRTQLPDPLMQSYLGAANTPAYRGLAYVVFNELNLQQWGNYMPSLTFEVVRGASPVTVVTGQQNVNTAANPGIPNANFVYPCQILSDGTTYGLVNGQSGSHYVNQFYKMTPYGVTWLNQPFSTGLAFICGQGCYSYDTPGFLFTDGYWRDINQNAYAAPIAWGLFYAANASAILRNGYLYTTVADGSTNFPIYIQQLGQLGTPPSFTSQGNFAFQKVLCASDSYIYALTQQRSPTAPSSVVQFDQQGNYIRTLFSMSGPIYGMGYCVNDNQIYFNTNGYPNVMMWNGTSLVATSIAATNMANQSAMYVTPDGRSMWIGNYSSGNNFEAVVAGTIPNAATLSTIVSEICTDAGFQSSQFDASHLTDAVIGYATGTGNSSPRDMLSPLQGAFFFDVSDSDGMLKFVRRGAPPALTILWDDMGADSGSNSSGTQSPINEVVAQEFEMPAQTSLSYVSSSTDYQTLTQREFMPGTSSNLVESVSVPIVLADNDAKLRTTTMLWERWSKRRTFSWSTDIKYLELEPSDVVNLQRQDGSLLPVRITKTSLDGNGKMVFEGDFTVPQIYPNPGSGTPAPGYVAQGGSAAGFVKQSTPYNGPTLLQILDLPPLRPQDASSPGLYVAAAGMTGAWPGCLVDISRDDNSFSQIMAMTSASIIGYTQSALGTYQGGNTADELNTLTVYLYNPASALSSVNYAQFLNGVNACVVGNELVYFRTATQTGANTWVLSGLLRGRVGTEGAMSSHSAGERIVFLDQTKLGAMSINLTDIGQVLYFDAYLNNVTNKLSDQLSMVPANGRLAPLAPHNLVAVRGAPSTSGLSTDLVLRWFRRARVNYSWYDGVDVPLDWSQESYKVTIMTSANVVINTYTVGPLGVSWSGGFTPAGAAIAAQPVPQQSISSSGAISPAQINPPFTAPQQPFFDYTTSRRSADGLVVTLTYNVAVSQVGDYGVAGAAATTSFVNF